MTQNFKKLYSVIGVTPPFGIIEVTGPHGAGKTMFALTTGADMSRVCVLDCERSAEPYADWGFTWYDVIGKAGGILATGESIYATAAGIASKIPAGKYDVIVIDNITRIEEGMVDFVKRHPAKFGLTRTQIEKGMGLMWGPIKNLERQFLLDLKAKSHMVIVTVHLGPVWAGKKPVPGLYKPKGKEVLRELASLSIWLRFSSGPIPAGLVMKARMARLLPDGAVYPVLPPKLPRATWAEIRRYMQEPFDPDHPKPEEVPTPDEWHALRGTLTKEQRDMLLAVMQSSENEEKEVQNGLSSDITVQDFIAEVVKNGWNLQDVLQKLGVENVNQISNFREAIQTIKGG